MGKLLDELKRRKVFRVAAVYSVVSWLVIQVAGEVLPTFNAPQWINQSIILLLLLGLPVALVLAWAFELTSQGIRKTEEIKDPRSTPFTKRDYVFSVALIFIIGLLVIQQVTVLNEMPVEAISSEPQNQGALAELLASLPEAGEIDINKSIAILPLSNLSPNPDNAYFAAGVHEEILNQLAKVSDLRVISRTAVLRYLDTTLSPSEIALELNVGAVMEGSVRYADNQVRITAQLIRADDDSHLWSNTYDRELADIFAIQSEVAIEVADALQANLLSQTRASIQRPATNSTDAYSLFLQTRYRQEQEDNIVNVADEGWIRLGIRDMRRAIDIDPGFARAYAELSFYLARLGSADPDTDYRTLLDERESLARRAVELDPSLGRSYDSLATISRDRREWAEAERYHELAIASEGAEPRLLGNFAFSMSLRGKDEAAYALSDRYVNTDPSSNFAWSRSTGVRITNRDYDAALLLVGRVRSTGNELAYYGYRIAALYYLGRQEEALADLNIYESLNHPSAAPSFVMYALCRLGHIPQAADSDEANNLLQRLAISLCLDDSDGTFAIIKDGMQRGENIWGRGEMYDPLRADPRWAEVQEYMNLPLLR